MEEEINLLEYWQVVVKAKWLIISLIIVSVLFTMYSNMRQVKKYQATASIMLVGTSGGGLVPDVASLSLFGNGGTSDDVSKLSSILKSATLSTQVARSLDLNEFFPDLLPALDREEKISIAAGRLRGAVKSKSDEALFFVTVEWTNPDYPPKFANRYVEELGKFLSNRAMNINFQVIDHALSGSLINTQPKLKVVSSAILGLLMGIFIAFLLHFVHKFRATYLRRN